jgi:outer membrane protein OmpA-like peptidoglycan-associated protein
MFIRRLVLASLVLILAVGPSAAEDMTAEEILSGLKAMAPASDSQIPGESAEDIIKTLKNSADSCASQADALHELSSVNLSISFDYKSADISPKSFKQLKQLADALGSSKLKSRKILIAGHTDAKGSKAYNLDLSNRRADAVRTFLLTLNPDIEERLETVGCGFSILENPGDPLAAENRRVQVINLGS